MGEFETTDKKKEKKQTHVNIKSIIIIIITILSVMVYMALGVWVPIPLRFEIIPFIVILGVLLVLIANSRAVSLKKKLICVVFLGYIVLALMIIKKPSGVDTDRIICKYYPISENNYEMIYENQIDDITLNVYLDKNVNQVYYCIFKLDGKKKVLERCYRSIPAWVLKNYDKEISKIDNLLSKEGYKSDEMVLVSLYEITQTEKYRSSQISLRKSVNINNKEVYIYKFSR